MRGSQNAREKAAEMLPAARSNAPQTGLPLWPAAVAALVIVAAGVVAYSNSFNGPEILDDPAAISRNPYIRTLWPITEAMKAPPQEATAGRPLVCLSLALNYRINTLLGLPGLDVRGFHVLNLTFHLLAGLVLFGIIRRTLRCPRLESRFGDSADVLAAICALFWVLHPLQTGAVDYIVQRAEAMMGLFYLLTVYCAVRSFASPAKRLWFALATMFCALGMGTKEVMVTAPLLVALYDRIFVAKSFRDLTKRKGLYLPLAATWLILAGILATAPRGKSTGLSVGSPLQYAQAQCEIILHYIRLAFWPDRLVLDYGWQMPDSIWQVAPYAAGLLVLLAATAIAIRYRPEIGFLGAWFFLILGPTSSFMPIKDLAFEHRMYLSLAALITGVVLCAYSVCRRLAGRHEVAFAVAGIVLSVGAALSLGWRTYLRNEDYSSAVKIWTATVKAAQHNARAYSNLAYAHKRLEQYDLALRHYGKAIELDPDFHDPYSNRGLVYYAIGEDDRAIADFTIAIRLRPDFANNYNDRAAAYTRKGNLDRALADLNEAVRLAPGYTRAKDNRARLLQLLKMRKQSR